MTVEIKAVRALLSGWAKWKRGQLECGCLSTPNLIYRLMVGDVVSGGGFNSKEPAQFINGHSHHPVFNRLDCIIGRLSERQKETIYCEFNLGGYQKHKAKYMGISLHTYKEYLNLAINQISNDDYIQNLIV